MKILIIEDDERIAIPVKEELVHQNYVVDIAHDGAQGLLMARLGQYDVLVLDLMLPKLSGISVCSALRREGNTAAILMLTARNEKQDKVQGLDAGADDYLTKPFDLEELSARVRALARRSTMERRTIVECGNVTIDTAACRVWSNDKNIELTPTEYRLLLHFARNPATTFSSEELLGRLWSQDEAPGLETVKTHLKTLRRKLSSAGADSLIETVYGFGYKLKDNV